MKRPLAVAIMGPTASGKTAAALQIARQIPSEIISVDSALVYRGMDVGTAKPSLDERHAVPHHLIDIIEPTDAYSVMQFRQDTIRLVEDISSRGKLALLVGGTMMYFKGLTQGLDALPAADMAIRAQLDADAASIGIPGLHARLAILDPVTAARLAPNDAQRVQRALEIIEITQRPMSELLTLSTSSTSSTSSIPPAKTNLPFDLLSFSLEPSDRLALHTRIAARFDAMLQENPSGPNLIQEVQTLRARGDLHPNLPSMRCVGYRQTWEYLDGMYDRATLREKGIIATRQLAKRQLTWLRAMPDKTVIDCLGHAPAAVMLSSIAKQM